MYSSNGLLAGTLAIVLINIHRYGTLVTGSVLLVLQRVACGYHKVEHFTQYSIIMLLYIFIKSHTHIEQFVKCFNSYSHEAC